MKKTLLLFVLSFVTLSLLFSAEFKSFLGIPITATQDIFEKTMEINGWEVKHNSNQSIFTGKTFAGKQIEEITMYFIGKQTEIIKEYDYTLDLSFKVKTYPQKFKSLHIFFQNQADVTEIFNKYIAQYNLIRNPKYKDKYNTYITPDNKIAFDYSDWKINIRITDDFDI